MLTYGSVCSGYDAATLAWHPLGWRPKFFAEIEPFPSAVLAHHYGSNMPGEPLSRNGVPNHGDFTAIPASAGPVDLLVGGTPCQSFSIAGKRLGLDDPRGNLALEYVRLAKRLGARWVVWENVPGVLSSTGGRDFADFLGFLAGRDIGAPRDGWRNAGIVAGIPSSYGLAWRVLDAQYVRVDGFARAVPRRRKRVVVVGYLGDWRRAAAVLFEPEGMPGHPPPRREAEKTASVSFGDRSGDSGVFGTEIDQRLIAGTVSKKWAKGTGGPAGDECYNLIAVEKGGEKVVRRLTPLECERLQGVPEGLTDIRWQRRRASDKPRYEALGNSMAVNFMRWIGQRIDLLERLIREGRI